MRVRVGVLARDKAQPVRISDLWRHKHGAAGTDPALGNLEPAARIDVVELVRTDRAVVDENVGKVVLHARPIHAIGDVGQTLVFLVRAAGHRDARLFGDRIAPMHLVGDDHHAVTAVAALPVRLNIAVFAGHGAATAASTRVRHARRGKRSVFDVRRIAADTRTARTGLGESGSILKIRVSAAATGAIVKRVAEHVAGNARAAGTAAIVLVGTGRKPRAIAAAATACRIRAVSSGILLVVAGSAFITVSAIQCRRTAGRTGRRCVATSASAAA